MYEDSSQKFRDCRTSGAKGALLSSFLFLTLLFPAPNAQAATPAFVQSAAAYSTAASVAAPYTKAEAAGDTNIVVVGWNDVTTTIKTVTDSQGNIYALAAGPTIVNSGSNHLTQAIYYAANINAGV